MLSDQIAVLILSAPIAFIVTYFLTPYMIRWQIRVGMTGPDVHKPHRPQKPRVGGFAVVLGYAMAISAVAPFLPVAREILAASLTISFAALVGAYDDLFGLRQRVKVVLLFMTSVPLIWMYWWRSTIVFPFLGVVDFGLIYPLLLVPIAVSVVGNLTNMLAGFNGLEAGMGSIALISVTIIGIILGRTDAAFLSLPMAAALLAFLFFNWYPAKAFPGDTATLTIGVVLAAAIIVGRFEILGVIIMLPYLLDFLMKFASATSRRLKPFSQREVFGDATVSDDGTLRPPPYWALAHIFMRLKPMTEKSLVKTLLALQAALGVLAISLALYMVNVGLS